MDLQSGFCFFADGFGNFFGFISRNFMVNPWTAFVNGALQSTDLANWCDVGDLVNIAPELAHSTTSASYTIPTYLHRLGFVLDVGDKITEVHIDADIVGTDVCAWAIPGLPDAFLQPVTLVSRRAVFPVSCRLKQKLGPGSLTIRISGGGITRDELWKSFHNNSDNTSIRMAMLSDKGTNAVLAMCYGQYGVDYLGQTIEVAISYDNTNGGATMIGGVAFDQEASTTIATDAADWNGRLLGLMADGGGNVSLEEVIQQMSRRFISV